MGKASGHGDGIVQTVVCLVTVAGQVSMKPAVKELHRMVSRPGPLVIEERHLRGTAVFIRKIYPHPVLGGTLLVRFANHLYPRLVTVDVPAFEEFLFHLAIQQLQVTVRTADDPVGHGFCGKVQAIPGEFPFLSSQRHPVDILGIHNSGYQGRCCNTSLNQRRYLFRTLHGTAFRTAVYIGHFFHNLESCGNKLQALYGFFGNNLVLLATIRAVTVFPGQRVFGRLRDFKA